MSVVRRCVFAEGWSVRGQGKQDGWSPAGQGGGRGGSENCWDCVMFLGYVLSIVFHDFRNKTNLAKIIVDYV